MGSYHRDVLCTLKERGNCTVEAVTFVWLSGGACIHTLEWLLLALNIVILLHYLLFISLILHSMFFLKHKNYPGHLNE